MSAKKYLTVDQVAEIFQVKRAWVYKYVPAVPLPGRLKRFDPEVVLQLKSDPKSSSLTTKQQAKDEIQKRAGGSSTKKEPLWE